MLIEVDGLLIKVRSDAAFAAANLNMLGKAEIILEVPPGSTGGMGLAADEHTSWRHCHINRFYCSLLASPLDSDSINSMA